MFSTAYILRSDGDNFTKVINLKINQASSDNLKNKIDTCKETASRRHGFHEVSVLSY